MVLNKIMNISSDIIFLFQQIKVLEMQYKRVADSSVDQFNIFSILHKSHDEVKLHSKFIYELLNPNGSHMQGDMFLKLFLKEVDILFEMDNVSVYREKDNIDILIKTKNKAIIIENKIYTEDHSKQLSTYLKVVEKQGFKTKDISLIYLTLYGDEPNENAVKEKVKNISYESHIKCWLDNCIKEVSTLPTIRETIVQYLSLIKHLTNQSETKGYIMSIKELLLENDNFKLALDMQKSIKELKIDIQYKFWNDLQNSLNKQNLNFKFVTINQDNNFKEATKNFYEKQKNNRHFGLEYELDTNLVVFIEVNHRIFYGFYTKNAKFTKNQREKIEKIEVEWEKSNVDMYWKYPDRELHFKDFNENVINLAKDEIRKNIIISISQDIESLVKQYKY